MEDIEIKTPTSVSNDVFLHKVRKKLDASSVINFIILLIIAGISFVGLINFNVTGKSPLAVISSGLISFLAIYCIDSLLMNKGILDAKKTPEYKGSLQVYADEIEKHDNNAEFLDDFCEEYNEQRRKKIIKSELKRVHLKWEIYESGHYEHKEEIEKLSKRQKATINYINRLKLFQITSDFLLVDSKSQDRTRDGKPKSVNDYMKPERIIKIITILGLAILSACIEMREVTLSDFLAAMLYGVINGTLWVAKGAMSYFKYYNYTKNVHRQNIIIYKTNILAQFNEIMKKNKDRYTKKEEVTYGDFNKQQQEEETTTNS